MVPRDGKDPVTTFVSIGQRDIQGKYSFLGGSVWDE